MLFPESYLAPNFWLFVRDQAIDGRTNELGVRITSKVVNPYNQERAFARTFLRELRGPFTDDFDPDYEEDEGEGTKQPWTYKTLQEALLMFLLAWVYRTQPEPPVTPTYEIWLRTVALILADAARLPELLTLRVPEYDRMNPELAPKGTIERCMVISDDWSCLSRDTFDFIMANYCRHGISSV